MLGWFKKKLGKNKQESPAEPSVEEIRVAESPPEPEAEVAPAAVAEEVGIETAPGADLCRRCRGG